MFISERATAEKVKIPTALRRPQIGNPIMWSGLCPGIDIL
jgi:hypothetical protein